jgi:hypothetical protein
VTVINASPAKQPPKVVDAVTAVESLTDKVENKIDGAAPAQKAEVVVSTTAPATPVAKVSWLKKVGSVIGKILGIVAKDAKPVADTITQVVSVLYPGLASLAQAGDGLVSKIALEATAVEGVAAAAGTATGTGAQKLEAVLASPTVTTAINDWVASAFPGAASLTAATKAGLVNAVVAIINEIDPAAAPPTPTA